MNRVSRTVEVTRIVSFIALGVTAILSCSRTNVASEQKWLSFRRPDGQMVMAQFQLPEDQFVNVRFAAAKCGCRTWFPALALATATARRLFGTKGKVCSWK